MLLKQTNIFHPELHVLLLPQQWRNGKQAHVKLRKAGNAACGSPVHRVCEAHLMTFMLDCHHANTQLPQNATQDECHFIHGNIKLKK